MRYSPAFFRILFVVLLLTWQPNFLESAQPPVKALTPEQQDKLKESRHFSKESSALEKEGRLGEAIAAAEKMLDIERAVFGDVHPDVVGSLVRLARMHERLEEFPAALKERNEVLRLRIKLHGEQAWEVIDARLDLKRLETLVRLDGKARQELKEAEQWLTKAITNTRPDKYQESAEFADRALQARVQWLGEDQPLTAYSVSWAGFLWAKAKKLDTARMRHEQALAFYKKGCGERHPNTAQALQNLGSAVLGQRDYGRASVLFGQSLAIRKQVLGDKHPTTVSFLSFLSYQADSLASQAKYEEQKDHLPLALQIRQAIVQLRTIGPGDNHWKVTNARLDVELVETLARLDAPNRRALREADQWIGKALAQIKEENAHAPSGVAVKAVSLREHLTGNQAPTSSAARAGQFDDALGSFSRALAIQNKVLGADHPQTAATLNQLGVLLYRQGDYSAARPCYEQALATRQRVLGANHPDTAACLNNLGALLDCQGDYALARPYYEQALAIQKGVPEDNRAETMLILNNLGSVLSNQENYAAARPYFEEALALSRKTLGPYDSATALALNNLGTLLCNQGDFKGARALFEQALAINNKALGDSDPDTVFSLNNLGVLLCRQGDVDAARPYFEQTLALRKKVLGEQHPDTAFSLNNLGVLLYELGDTAGARSNFQRALDISRRNLDLAAAAQSERQQFLMGMRLRDQFHNLLSLPWQTEADVSLAYTYVLAWKGSVLARQQQLRAERHYPKLRPLVNQLRDTAGELASLAFAVPEPRDRQQWTRHLESLTQRKEDLERELAQKSQRFRAHQELKNLTPDRLRALLPPDTVLVDFLVHRHGQPDPKKKGRRLAEDRLTAFIVKSGSPLVRFDLGPMAPVEKAIDLWRARTKDRSLTDQDHPGMELRRRLWLPLEKHLAGAKMVLVSPDGALARLPFAALPGSKQGSYLLEEEVTLSVVPVPRLLPELLDKHRKDEQGEQPSLLLVGDVDFDAAAKAGLEGRAAATGERTGERKMWQRLPATREEIAAIRDSFEQRFTDGKLTILRGDRATQTSLRELASKYSHLHLATHGFFAPPSVRSALAADEKERSSGDLFDKQGVTGFHPGLLSGLVLAGANKPPALGQSDGILTALEVAELDLSKVELAVLSACATGLGKEAAGEGLLGLQRAFQVAGANSVVASLWSVDDDATRKLMVRFYENHWDKKMSKREALRQAQLSMLRGELVRGLVLDEAKNNPRLPPHYWAAFVLSGDWR